MRASARHDLAEDAEVLRVMCDHAWHDYPGEADDGREALARLTAALEAQEKDFALKDRALTDYFADASRRADDAEQRIAEWEAAWSNFTQWRDYRVMVNERIAELEAALRPFAIGGGMTVGREDIIRARAALGKEQK